MATCPPSPRRRAGTDTGLFQGSAATQSSPGLEEAAATAARAREEAYLAGLAGQYRLEQYPDSYEAMCEWGGRGRWAGAWPVCPLSVTWAILSCSGASHRPPPPPRAPTGLLPPRGPPGTVGCG